jgi:hypothetical protein
MLPDSERRSNWIASLVEADLARRHYGEDIARARNFALSGLFTDIKTGNMEQQVAAAMVKIQLGRSWGFTAADSMQHIYFINGRPSVGNSLVAAKLQQAGYDWDVEWYWEDATNEQGKVYQKCTGCRLWPRKWSPEARQMVALTDREGRPISVAFTKDMADMAEINEGGKRIKLSEKWNFKSWGQDMFYWRCISRLQKYHAPHVLRGGVMRDEATELPPLDPPDMELLPPAAREAEPPAAKVSLRDLVMKQEAFAKPPEATGAKDESGK